MSIDSRINDIELMNEWYWEEKMSLNEIADKLGCSKDCVIKYFDRHGIERRSRGADSDADYEKLRDAEYLSKRYHDGGLYLDDIAADLNCSRWLVTKWFNKHGIDTHSRGLRPGEDHPFYKAEKSAEYGPNWYRQRKAALERDGDTCQRCGLNQDDAKREYTKGLNVHHIRPRSEFLIDGELDHERANELSNLITLCHGCHKKLEGLPVDNRERASA